MNLDYLTTYLNIIETGSFSEVAKRLGISQPAVSFQVQKLERDLGVRLIDRTRHPLAMTEAGKQLYRFARVVAEEQARLRDDLDRMREEVTGDLVIAASTIPGEMLVPSLVGRFRAMHPMVGVRVDIFDSGTVIEQVSHGSYEIGFCGVAPETGNLERVKVAEDEIVLIVFPGHPFAGRESITLMDLQGEALVLRQETSGTMRNVRSLMAEAGVDLEGQSPGVVLSTTQAVVSAVEARVGIGFVSSLAVAKSQALGLVQVVPIEGFALRRSFYCIYRQDRVATRLLGEFVSFVNSGATSSPDAS